jgi:hypothetical protein
MNIFSPQSGQSFTEQLQNSLPDISPISLDFLNRSPPFDFGIVESGQEMSMMGTSLDPFVSMEGNQGEGMGMDMDDPVLNSLQTLAEGFGNMEQPQNMDMWEWFEMQQS